MHIRRPFFSSSLYSLLLFFIISVNAEASIISYFDRASWLADVGTAVITEDFNAITADQIFTNSSVVVNGLTFSSTGGAAGAMLIDSLSGGGGGIDNTPFLNAAGLLPGSVSSPESILTITLPSEATAFGFDMLNYDSRDEQAEIFINGSSVGLTPISNGDIGFLGVIADSAMVFTTIEIRGARASVDVAAGFDNIVYNQFVVVPVPAAIWLLGSGLVVLLGIRKKLQ